jgi:hypothetical protein
MVTTTLPATGQTRTGPVQRFVRRHLYRAHRIVGLLTIVPVICWTLSGLLHPLMSNWLRPKIARETLPLAPAPRPALPLTQVLAQHQLNYLRSVRLVRWHHQPTYQVLTGHQPTAEPRYFNAATGAALSADADQRFAQQLARYFTQDSTSRIVAAERLTRFTIDYPVVNRLLPVWKITFDRPGVTTVYVETMPARLAAFNNPTREVFLRFFSLLHSWAWLELPGSSIVRVIMMLVALSIILISTLSGLVVYGLLWGKFRQPRNAHDHVGWLRKYHRTVGLAVAFVTFTFAGSGAFHVWLKLHPDERLRYQHALAVATSQLTTDLTQLPLRWPTVQNVGLVELNGQAYYQVFHLPPPNKSSKKAGLSTGQPLQAVRPAAITYYSAATGQVLVDGNAQVAAALATAFLTEMDGHAAPAIAETAPIDHFEGEYGFVNKRLPVVKVAFRTPQHTTLYVETSTGRLSTSVEDIDRYEGLSFAFLHKFHAVDSLGKNLRDIITMLAAAGVLAVSLLGLQLFIKGR